MKKLTLCAILALFYTISSLAFTPVITAPSVAIRKYAGVQTSVTITVSLPAAKEVVIHWGDGQTDTVTGPQTATAYSNTYGDAATNYVITMTGDFREITYFQIVEGEVRCDVALFYDIMPNLTRLSLYSNVPATGKPDHYGSINGVKKLTSLDFLRLNGSTEIIGDLSSIAGLTSLTDIRFDYTAVSGDLADLAPLTALTSLRIDNNSGTITYTQGTLPDWDACVILINSTGLNQQEVDDFLCDLDTASSASASLLDIRNVAPSATGLACKTSLEGKGWTVTVTP